MATNLVIVAIPNEDDYVWKISSEKKPHMTLLFLGELGKATNVSQMADFVMHASTKSLKRFGMEVERRNTLGEDEADVLFFNKKWATDVTNFRSQLLKDDNIFKAYSSVEQFPEWVPHMTMGYPATPAKEDTRDYPGINYVSFDKIGFWFGEYEGLEFQLPDYDWDMEVSMSTIDDGKSAVEDALAHFGIKGMKWGVRRSFEKLQTSEPTPVTVKTQAHKNVKTAIKTKGGHAHPAAADAVKAKTIQQVYKKSGKNALSNEELQAMVNRLNLELQAERLEPATGIAAGQKWISDNITSKPEGKIAVGLGKAALSTPALHDEVGKVLAKSALGATTMAALKVALKAAK